MLEKRFVFSKTMFCAGKMFLLEKFYSDLIILEVLSTRTMEWALANGKGSWKICGEIFKFS